MHIWVSPCVSVGTTVFSRYLRGNRGARSGGACVKRTRMGNIADGTHCLTCSLLAPAVMDAPSGSDMVARSLLL